MPQQAFVDQGIRLNPVGVTAIVAVHAAAIGALILAKGPEIAKQIFPPTQVELIQVPPDPEPLPQPEPRAQPQRQLTRIDTPPPIVPTPTQGPVITTPPIPPQPWTPTPPGNDIVVEPTPPPPPPPPPTPPRVVEAARARGSLQGLFRPDDYPISASERGDEGSAGVRLSIGPDGRVTNCAVTRSSGSQALDGATCRVLRSRARYTPARDQNNQPVADTQSATITWRLTD